MWSARDERIIVITPARGLFYCFDAKVGGDCLALVQHITGLDVQDAANYLAPKEATVPQAARVETTAPKKKEAPKEFDPATFAAKLSYTDEVSALGITDATRLGIGFTRGKVYIALRDEFGFTAGFVAFSDGQLKMPPKLLQNTNVVKLKHAFFLRAKMKCGRSKGGSHVKQRQTHLRSRGLHR